MAATIRCEGLTKQYGDVVALQSLDLDIPAGAIFGFLGRNGAGKTTTMRLLTGLAHPTSGRAWVNGLEMSEASPIAQQQFGYLPQDPAFYTWMTPQEYLGYVADLFRMRRQDKQQRIADMLELVGLKDAATRKIHGFSGGMVQRLGIAQALIHNPPILFLDEPTSALDPAGRYDVLSLIESLRGEVTVFLSSHILADIERVCDTIGIIHEGKLITVEKRDDLLARYATDSIMMVIEEDSLPRVPRFIETLEAVAWVTAVTHQNDQLRVTVNASEPAKRQLMSLVVQHEIALSKYEWIRPTLEEIFLQIK